MTEEQTCPAIERGPGGLGHQCGLAQTGLARDQEDLAAFACGDALGGVGQGLHLGLSSDDTDGRAHGQTAREWDGGCGVRPAEGFPQHLNRVDRIGQSLQGQFPEGSALVAVAPPGHAPHDVRGQNLSTLTGGTEPGCFDDGVPGIVVIFSGNLATAEAHPQADRVLPVPVVSLDDLLHGHGTRQGGRGRGEGHHEPVAEVFHFGPA